jgi:hypothetical protein
VASVADVVDAIVRFGLGTHPYEYVLRCGHEAPAPIPSVLHGDEEVRPAFVDCPVCGVPRIVDAYRPEGVT